MVRQHLYCCALAASVGGAIGMLPGCVPPRRDAFAPVQALVRQRTGLRVAWRERAAEGASPARLKALLGKPLTADAAVEIALLNNHDLRAELESIGVGLGDLAEASVLRNPEISADVRWPTQANGQHAVEFHAAEDLASLLTLPRRRKAAFASLDAARADAAAAVIDLVARVRDAVLDVQATHQVVHLRQTVRDSVRAQLELTKRLYEAGNIAELAVDQQQALLVEAELDLSRAETAAVGAREQLNAILGLTAKETGWTIADALPALPNRTDDLAHLEQVAVAHNLGLEREHDRVRAAAERIGVARLEGWLPALGAGVSAQKEVGGDWTVGPEVVLSVPLFDRKQGARIRGYAELRRAQHRYVALVATIRAAARAARSELEGAHRRAHLAQSELVPDRQKVLAETLLHYNAMNASPFELLQAERDRIRAGIEAIESLRDYWRAEVRVSQIRAGSVAIPMNQEGMK